jgi:hypothetical protein
MGYCIPFRQLTAAEIKSNELFGNNTYNYNSQSISFLKTIISSGIKRRARLEISL